MPELFHRNNKMGIISEISDNKVFINVQVVSMLKQFCTVLRDNDYELFHCSCSNKEGNAYE